jgi:hypothetical protein
MKTDAEVRLYMKERSKGRTEAQAAAKAGMSLGTARKYERAARAPSQLKQPRTHRTHPNPFVDDWCSYRTRWVIPACSIEALDGPRFPRARDQEGAGGRTGDGLTQPVAPASRPAGLPPLLCDQRARELQELDGTPAPRRRACGHRRGARVVAARGASARARVEARLRNA